MVISEGQQKLSVVVENISAIDTENFAILASYPSLLSPPCACVDNHQHEQLFVSRYVLHSSVQGCPKCMFLTSIMCLSWGIRDKKRHGFGLTT